GGRQGRPANRGAELQSLRDGRILCQSVRAERARRARPDEATDPRLEPTRPPGVAEDKEPACPITTGRHPSRCDRNLRPGSSPSRAWSSARRARRALRTCPRSRCGSRRGRFRCGTGSEGGSTDPGPRHGACAGGGGLARARHVLDHPEVVAGRRVLDFGTGSGLAAIAAARAGADRVVANDVDPFALVALSLNTDANGVTVEPSVSDLMADASDFDPAAFDVVLAGDVFYDHDFAPRALALLTRCRAAGAHVLIGDPGRADLPIARLRKISNQTVPVTRDCQYLAASQEAAHDLHAAAVWTFA